MDKDNSTRTKEFDEFEKIRSHILSTVVKRAYIKCGITGENFRYYFSKFLNAQTKTSDYTDEKVRNYLYGKTPWPELDCNTFIISVLQTLQKASTEADDREAEKYFYQARADLKAAYELSKNFDRIDIVGFFKSQFDTVLQLLNDVTTAVLIKNPEILSSLTQDDIDFMILVSNLNREQQRQEVEAYLKRSVRMSVQDIFKSITTGEAVCWLNLCLEKEDGVNQPTQKQKKHFERFLKKADVNEFTSLFYIATCCINKMIPSTAVPTMDKPSGLFLPFDEEEVTLLVLFKYCMPMNEKMRVLAELEEMRE